MGSPNTARRFTSRSTIALLMLVMTLMLSAMDTLDMERERLKLIQDTMDILLDPSASNMLRSSATRSPSRTPERSPDQCARLLLTPPTLRSVRTLSPLSAPRPTPRSTIALLLLVMTLRSSRDMVMQVYGKRDADPGYGSIGPICKEHVEKQCHKVPQHHERKVPRKECKSVPKEQCHPVAHKVPRKVCATYEYGKGHGHGHGGHGHGHGHHGK